MSANTTSAENKEISLSSNSYYLNVTHASEINIDVNSIPNQSVTSTTKDNLTIKSNVPKYDLYLSTPYNESDSSKLYMDGDNTSEYLISPSSKTKATKGSLENNTWGYSIDNGSTYSAVPTKDNAESILTKNTNTTGSDVTDNFTVTYGTKTDYNLPAGNYTGEITYSVLADIGSNNIISSISPSTIVSTLEQYRTITIQTSIMTTMDYGTWNVTVGDNECTNPTTSTIDGALAITCVAPILTNGSKNVTITSNKFSTGSTSTIMYAYDLNLTDIKIDGTTVTGFTENTTEYTIQQNNVSSITLAATQKYSDVSISGVGTISLVGGKNVITIKTSNTTGVTKTYTLTINNGPAVGTVWNYDYTGAAQTFTVPANATYKVELWGAQGGTDNWGPIGGKGAYVSGQIGFSINSDIYVYVGEGGLQDKGISMAYGTYMFNGGSSGNYTCYNYHNGGTAYNSYGGGATDVRLANGAWNNTDSLRSRIMVAAGGASGNQDQEGVPAGGITGYSGKVGTGASQTSGGNYRGGFGYGGTPAYNGSTCSSNTKMGAGSGYYGGGAANDNSVGMYSAGSGSSFISGHNGCNAINSSGAHTGQSVHYSGYKFTNTVMIDGAGYNWTTSKGSYVGQPQPDGSTAAGRQNHGYARITLVSY